MSLLNLPAGTEEDDSYLHLYHKHQIWKKSGRKALLHRIRGPAVIYSYGKEEWYRHGKLYTPTAHEKMLWELRKKNESV